MAQQNNPADGLQPPLIITFGGTVKVYINENVGIKYCVDRAQKLSSEYASRTPFFSESIHLGLFHISDMLMRRLSNLGTKGERNLSNPPVKLGWERVVRGSSPSSATMLPLIFIIFFIPLTLKAPSGPDSHSPPIPLLSSSPTTSPSFLVWITATISKASLSST